MWFNSPSPFNNRSTHIVCNKEKDVPQAPLLSSESESISPDSRLERGEEAFRELARKLGRAAVDANPGILKSQ